MARFNLKRRSKKGFSLIELLIVIAIIGIIATIAIPILLSARVNAINEKARNSLRSVVSAEAAYYAAFGTYGSASELGGANANNQQYVDDAVANNTVANVSITITPNDQQFTAVAAAETGTTPYHTYTATETGEIVTS